jgi:hypothetical protein
MPEKFYGFKRISSKTVDLREFGTDHLEELANGTVEDESRKNLYIQDIGRIQSGIKQLLKSSLVEKDSGCVEANIRLKGGVWISKKCFDFLNPGKDKRVNVQVTDKAVVSLVSDDRKVAYTLQGNKSERRLYSKTSKGEWQMENEESDGVMIEMLSIVFALENKALVSDRRASAF